MPDGLTTDTISRERALALPYDEPLATRARQLAEALRRGRQDDLTLARGRPDALARTYAQRLTEAGEQRVPTVGIQALLDELPAHEDRAVWGFTVRDASMIYLAFTDEDVERLIAVVIVARTGAESLLHA